MIQLHINEQTGNGYEYGLSCTADTVITSTQSGTGSTRQTVIFTSLKHNQAKLSTFTLLQLLHCTFPADVSAIRHSLSVHFVLLSLCSLATLEVPQQMEKCLTLLDVHTLTTIREDSSHTSNISCNHH